MRIISRQEWGANYASAYKNLNAPLPAKEVWLHHSATRASDDVSIVRTIEQIGQSRFGWGMSYTFLIGPNGTVFEGHRINGVGSHTAGRNSTARGICLIGNYDVEVITWQQLMSTASLLAHGYKLGWWQQPKLNGGHRDLKATACPGQFAYMQIESINQVAREMLDQKQQKGDSEVIVLMKGNASPAVYVVKIDPQLITGEGEPTCAVRTYINPIIGPAVLATGNIITVPQAALNAIVDLSSESQKREARETGDA